MSGGAHEYFYAGIEDLCVNIASYSDNHPEVRKRLVARLKGLQQVLHDIEWSDSGDYGPDDWANVANEWLDGSWVYVG